ncbi:MAG: hypothetical protein WBG63_00430, partial [Phormidesmis sp.]
TEISRPLMPVRIYDLEIESQLREYAVILSSNNTRLINDILELFFEMPTTLDDDPLRNMRELKKLLSSIDWESVRQRRDALRQRAITRNVTTAAVAADLINYPGQG